MECRQPTNIVSQSCSGLESCDLVFTQLEINDCVEKYADLLEYTFMCIPSINIFLLKFALHVSWFNKLFFK